MIGPQTSAPLSKEIPMGSFVERIFKGLWLPSPVVRGLLSSPLLSTKKVE